MHIDFFFVYLRLCHHSFYITGETISSFFLKKKTRSSVPISLCIWEEGVKQLKEHQLINLLIQLLVDQIKYQETQSHFLASFFLCLLSEKRNLVCHKTAECTWVKCFPSLMPKNYKIQLPIHVCNKITTYGEVWAWMLLKEKNHSLAPKAIW